MPFEIIHRVFDVFGTEAVQHHAELVGPVITVVVFGEDHVGRLRHVRAAVRQGKPVDHVQMVEEDRMRVCYAVLICVFEDDHRIARPLSGNRLRPSRRVGQPQAASGIEIHCHRVGHGKVSFRGEEIDLVALICSGAARAVRGVGSASISADTMAVVTQTVCFVAVCFGEIIDIVPANGILDYVQYTVQYAKD